jgi:hypothetical protein
VAHIMGASQKLDKQDAVARHRGTGILARVTAKPPDRRWQWRGRLARSRSGTGFQPVFRGNPKGEIRRGKSEGGSNRNGAKIREVVVERLHSLFLQKTP